MTSTIRSSNLKFYAFGSWAVGGWTTGRNNQLHFFHSCASHITTQFFFFFCGAIMYIFCALSLVIWDNPIASLWLLSCSYEFMWLTKILLQLIQEFLSSEIAVGRVLHQFSLNRSCLRLFLPSQNTLLNRIQPPRKSQRKMYLLKKFCSSLLLRLTISQLGWK